MTDPGDAPDSPLRVEEIIVVEGRDDERAVKAAVDAEMIVTSGYGLTKETWARIEAASKRTGVIIFTDPDHAGEQIRRKINQQIPGCKNAYLTREDARRRDNIGIENARPTAIRNALRQAHSTASQSAPPTFTLADLQQNRLMGHPQAAQRRAALGRHLAIGYANAKQFLRRLNRCGIDRAHFNAALTAIAEDASNEVSADTPLADLA
jgi:ribonuclease M5